MKKYDRALYYARQLYCMPWHKFCGTGEPNDNTGPAIFTRKDIENAYMAGWETGQDEQSSQLRAILGLRR